MYEISSDQSFNELTAGIKNILAFQFHIIPIRKKKITVFHLLSAVNLGAG